VLAFVLVFLRKFDDLSAVPAAYTSMIIVIVAGGPGKTVGACVQGVVLALLGVGIGSGLFAVLAQMTHVPVAQAVVFAAIVYGESRVFPPTPHIVPGPRRAPIPGGPFRAFWPTTHLERAFYTRNADDVIS
jgi:hypothetical protein